MIEPKRYKAQTLPPKTPDPFAGFRTREVEGYYYKHKGPSYAFDDGQDTEAEMKHYIVRTGSADWNMTRPVELHEIDIDTLKEIE